MASLPLLRARYFAKNLGNVRFDAGIALVQLEREHCVEATRRLACGHPVLPVPPHSMP